MHPWRWLPVAVLIMSALLAFGGTASCGQNVRETAAASLSEVAERQDDLKSLRSQIDTLRKEMASAEGSRRDAIDQLQDVERAISSTQRELHGLTAQIDKLQAKLQDLGSQSRELERTLSIQQTQLEKLLLSASEARQKEEHARLLAQRQQRQAMLDKISTQIAVQRREIGNLQRDEKRLTELVDRLSKVIAARAAEAREARREALRAAHRRESPRQGAPQEKLSRTPPANQEKSARAGLPADEDPAGGAAASEVRAENPPPVADRLASMKGQLRLPTRGSISNRFGTPRQEGSTWKGLFILASTGSEVRSIAAGRVVFAEWMRGFGNLLIIDHGGGYLSIYANNDALRKQVGDEVHSGEAIATVGNSGGNPESGLYFELRHQGKPLNPLVWVSPK